MPGLAQRAWAVQLIVPRCGAEMWGHRSARGGDTCALRWRGAEERAVEEEIHAATAPPDCARGPCPLSAQHGCLPPPEAGADRPHNAVSPGVGEMLRVWFLFPHNIRLRGGYWTEHTVPRIPVNGNSIVTTCHLPRLEGNGVNVAFERH